MEYNLVCNVFTFKQFTVIECYCTFSFALSFTYKSDIVKIDFDFLSMQGFTIICTVAVHNVFTHIHIFQ